MNNLYSLLFSFLLIIALTPAFAQCPVGEVEVQLDLLTDNWGYETSWEIVTGGNGIQVASGDNYGNYTLYQEYICVPDSTCLTFYIYDDFGDGIYIPGGYRLILAGDTIAQGADFGFEESVDFNCPPGEACNSAIPILQGNHIAPHTNYWYAFVPDSIGTYEITTCQNTCNTVIWVYESCDGIDLTAQEAGTYYYNNDNNICGQQATIPLAILNMGETYFIRIGDDSSSCADTSINWSINYNGPVVGCTDPLACNYEPLATVADSCTYPGDPDCLDGPDLVIGQTELINSMDLTQYTGADNCLVTEECLTGYGVRDIIRFATHIKNIGTMDYFIGDPTNNPGQFSTVNCHNHTHYKGYAEYLLYDANGQETPVGFKNGFCVMDITCDWGTPKYGCGTMGITAGCEDIYGAGTSCNWIDITDVDTGLYTFVARTNWDQDPDALGRVELDYVNNWAQVCLRISRTNGVLSYTVEPNCPTYTDCEGTAFGSAQLDCAGDCNGMRMMGDLDVDGNLNMADVASYVSGITASDLDPLPCNDLNADDEMTVYDAAMLANCLNFGSVHTHPGNEVHDHCNFPDGIVNINDTVYLSIEDVNFDQKYVDISITNPNDKVVAYQFNMKGLTITNVDNMVPPTDYPIAPESSLGGTMVLGISTEDSSIERSMSAQALCRINYFDLTDTVICIEQIIDVVNSDYEQVITKIINGCVDVPKDNTTAVTSIPAKDPMVVAYPNPFENRTTIEFTNPERSEFMLELIDITGKPVRQYMNITDSRIIIEQGQLNSGMYFYKLTGTYSHHGTLIIQ